IDRLGQTSSPRDRPEILLASILARWRRLVWGHPDTPDAELDRPPHQLELRLERDASHAELADDLIVCPEHRAEAHWKDRSVGHQLLHDALVGPRGLGGQLGFRTA